MQRKKFVRFSIQVVVLLLLPFMLSAQHKAQLIDVDANLYKVDEKLYRSEQLEEKDKRVLKATPIKTIINLRYFMRTANAEVFKGDKSVNLINSPLLTWRIKPKDIAQVLHMIRKYQKEGAVLIHCYHGADRTGIMVAMYRIIFHGWSIEQAKTEMQKGPYGYHSIWKNLDRLFTEKTVKEVKERLQKMSR